MDDPDPGPSTHAVAAGERPRALVEIVRHDARWPDDDASTGRLRLAAEIAFNAASVNASGVFSVVLAGDAEVRALNARWRGKDRPTNVLSFPLETIEAGIALGHAAGDIVLAYDTVQAEAREAGIGFLDHAAHLIVHGVLHVLGHDHDDDDAANAMERLETRILARMGIADPYAAEAPS